MGHCFSDLSDKQKQVLRHSSGLRVDDIKPLFSKYAIYTYKDRHIFNNHNIPNSIAFFVVRGEYIANAKSRIGKKFSTY
jgi:hypothetical protein